MVAGVGLARVDEEGLVGQLGDGDGGSLRERMAGGHDDALGLQPDEGADEFGRGRRAAHQARVERAVGDAGHDLGRGQQTSGHGDARVPLGQRRQQHGRGLVPGTRAVSDRQHAVLAPGESPDIPPQPVRLVAQFGTTVHQQPTGLGGFDGVGGAVEQSDAQLLLQLPDLAAQRRLGDVQPLGGPGEIPLLSNGKEVAKATQFRHAQQSMSRADLL